MTNFFARSRDITNCPLTKQNHLGKCSNEKLRTSVLINDGTLRSIADFASALSNADDDKLFFCGMIDRRKTLSLISSRDHCQKSSPSRISDTPRAEFEPAQNLSSGLV